jgi:ribosomal protein S18 acetylase RimI-like enzyme
MTIKQLNITDYAEIKRIWTEAGLLTRLNGRDSFNNLKKQLSSDNVTVLANELDGEIRGLVLLSHDERKGWINRLAVAPNYQRQGIASQLLKASENYFLEQGIEIFVTLIEAENEISIKCFERNGYKYWDNIRYFSKRSRDDI